MYENLERFWQVVREKLQSCVVGEGRYKQKQELPDSTSCTF